MNGVSVAREGDFSRFDIADGFRLYIHPTQKFKTVFIRLFIHRPLDDQATMFALLPHVLRRGCRRLPTLRSIVHRLERMYGASLNVDVTKIGERHVVYFNMTITADRYLPGNGNLLPQAIDLLHRLVVEPVKAKGRIRGDYIEQEKINLRRYIEGVVNDKIHYAFERCLQVMCGGEPYSLYEYGKLEDIAPISADEMTDFHRETIRTAPIDMCILGDVHPEKTARMVSRIFHDGRREVVSLAPTSVKYDVRKITERTEEEEVEQAKLIMGWRTVTCWSDEDAVPMLFFSALLGAFPHSKLFVNVREKEGLAYYVDSSLDLSKGILFVHAGIDRRNYRKVVDLIKKQIDDIAEGDISREEIDTTAKSLIDRFRSREDHPGAMINAHIEMSAGGAVLETGEVIGRIGRVTADDIVRAAKKIVLDTVYCLSPKESAAARK